MRVFSGRDECGRPTQVSRTVRGTKREAQRIAVAMESRAPSRAAGRTVEDVLQAWQEVNESVWSPASRRDYGGRVRAILQDPVAGIGLGRLGVADVERWHARMREAGVGEQAIRNRHSALRAGQLHLPAVGDEGAEGEPGPLIGPPGAGPAPSGARSGLPPGPPRQPWPSWTGAIVAPAATARA